MVIDKCPPQKRLMELGSGLLSDNDAAELAEHLDECPKCNETFHQNTDQADTLMQQLRKQPQQLNYEQESNLKQVQQALRDEDPSQFGQTAEATMITGTVTANVGNTEASATLPVQKSAPTESQSIPEQFGRYAIKKVLGQGAMGAVYLARDTQLDRDVALKIPKFDLPNTDNTELLERFYREARAAATLRSPNICPVYDVGDIDGQHYITMAFIEGRPLKDYTKSKKQHSEKQIASTIRKLAVGLAEAHELGVIHRDLKPANIMVDKKGEPVVMDFGLARRSSSDDVQVTQSNAILGTPAYMSPEQIEGDQSQIGPQTDIYSLGVIMYELMTGEMPFRGNLMALLQQISLNNPTPPSQLRENLDPRLEAICKKMMAGQKKERFQSMVEVANALEKVLRHPKKQETKPEKQAVAATAGLEVEVGQESNPMLISNEETRVMSKRMRDDHKRLAEKAQKRRKSSKGNNSGSRNQLLIAAAAGGIFLLLGIIFFVRVGKYEVQIELEDPEIKLSVDDEALLIDDGRGIIKLSAGAHKLKLEREGLETFVDEFTVTKDGKTALAAIVVDNRLSLLKNGEPRPPSATPKPNQQSDIVPVEQYALLFTKEPDQVEIPSLKLDLSQPLCLEAWVSHHEPIMGRVGLATRPNGSSSDFDLSIGNTRYGFTAFLRTTETYTYYSASSGVNYPGDGELMHLAAVREKGGIAIYVNGQLKERTTIDQSKQYPQTTPLFIIGQSLNGKIHELRVSQGPRYQGNFLPEQRFSNDEMTLALYHFDEGTGDILKDSSGNGHHGKIIGAKWVKQGDFSEASGDAHMLAFNGGTDRVEIPSLNLPDGPFTIELWGILSDQIDSSSSFSNVIAISKGDNYANIWYTETVDGLTFGRANNSTIGTRVPKENSSHRGRHSHYAGVWDGKTLTYFINGKPAGETKGAWGSVTNFGTIIGYLVSTTNKKPLAMPFHGQISQVRVSDSARYSDPFQPEAHLPQDSQTVAIYRFHEGTGDQLTDSSGNGHHGKIVGAKWVSVAEVSEIAEGSRKQQPGSGLLFDPSSVVDVGEVTLRANEPLTLEMWCTPDELDPGITTPVDRYAIRLGPFALKIMANYSNLHQQPYFSMAVQQAHKNRLATADAIASVVPHQLVHVAAQSDGEKLTLYINGKKDHTEPVSWGLDGMTFKEWFNEIGENWDKSWLTIGHHNPVNAKNKAHLNFGGVISQVRVSRGVRYTQDFTPGELMNDGQTVALYKFNEGSGNVLKDSSGNGFDGRIISPNWVSALVAGQKTAAPPSAIAPFDEAQAKAHQQAWADYLGVPVEYENSIGMKFRLIPPSEFMMGSTPEQIAEALQLVGKDETWKENVQSESPQHKVVLTKPVYVGVTEVTQSQYEQIMGNNPSHFAVTGEGKKEVTDLETGNHPVETVSWNNATEFCTKLSQHENLTPFEVRADGSFTLQDANGYRLPTEAEWESACRAGTTTRFWSGDEEQDLAIAGWYQSNSGGRTHAAGELKANPFGLSDVTGNVWEWVQDGWDPAFYGKFEESAAVDPLAASSAGSKRIIRGGGWGYQQSFCFSSSRYANLPTLRHFYVGFRVVLPVEAVQRAANSTASQQASAPFQEGEQVLQFDGNGAVTIQPIKNLKNFTAEAWVWWDGFDSDQPQAAILLQIAANRRMEIVPGSNNSKVKNHLIVNTVREDIPNGERGKTQVKSSRKSVPSGQWIHMALVSDNNQQRLYQDGELVINQSVPEGWFGDDSNRNTTLLLRQTRGKLRNFRLSNKALYQDSFTPPQDLLKDDTTLVLYHVNEGTGDVLKDSSGNGHHGKITGAKWVKFEDTATEVPATPAELTNAFLNWNDAPGLELTVKTDEGEQRLVYRYGKIPSLPAGPCEVTGVVFHNHMGRPATTEDVQRLAQAGLKHLQKVGFQYQETDPNWLAMLHVPYPGIREFHFNTGSEHMEQVARYDQLEYLQVTSRGDDWITLLKDKPINSLYIQQDIALKSWKLLAEYPQLTDLHVTMIAPEGLLALTKSSTITSLKITVLQPDQWKVQQADLEKLNAMANPQTLHIENRSEMPAGFDFEELKKKLPQTEIIYNTFPKGKRNTITLSASATTETSPDRAAAEWVISQGGSVVTDTGKYDSLEKLPASDLVVTAIQFPTDSEAMVPGSLAKIAGLSQLRELRTGNASLEDEDLIHLESFPLLEKLSLGGDKAQYTDAGLVHLKNLTELNWLSLGGTTVGDAGLQHLAGFNKLNFLTIARTQITDASLSVVASLPQLTTVHLQLNNITDAGLEQLAKSQSLNKISLFDTEISDAGLMHLQQMSQLVYLDVKNTKVTASGVDELKKTLPNCQISWNGN